MYSQMDVSQLVEQCRDETIRSRTMASGLTGFCLELFRRAIVEGCQPAWEAAHAQYHRLMLSWARSSNNWCSPEDIVESALERFLKAVKPETFARFTSIRHLLAFLRGCVRSVYIDRARRDQREQKGWGMMAIDDPPPADREPSLLPRIYERLKDEQECAVVYQSFELGFKPQEIAARRPDMFSSAHEVSRIKERVISRLAQDPGLRSYL